MTDDFSPIYVGDTGNPLDVTFTDHGGTPYVLVNVSSFTLALIDQNNDDHTVRTGVGTWQTINASRGNAQYAWNAADVAVAGVYVIRVTLIFPSGPITFIGPTPIEMKSR